jgi:hypothetical protein
MSFALGRYSHTSSNHAMVIIFQVGNYGCKSYHSWVAQLPHLSGTRIDSVDLKLASQQVDMVPSRTMMP